MRTAFFLFALFLGMTVRAGPPGEAYRGADADLLEQVREDFGAAPSSIEAVRDLAESMERRLPGEPAEWPPVFQAYRAALEGLAGKHSWLPWDKYNRTKAGLAKLDSLVKAYPESIEIRMLRFSFCLHLPEFFDMGPQAEADCAVLADQFLRGADLAVAGEYRLDLIQWILRNGKPTAEQKEKLQAAMAGKN